MFLCSKNLLVQFEYIMPTELTHKSSNKWWKFTPVVYVPSVVTVLFSDYWI